MTDAYLSKMLQPREVVVALNLKYGTQFNVNQVRRWVTANLSKRRRELVTRLAQTPVGVKTNAQIVAKHKDRHRKALERWAERSEKVVDTAFDALERTRDLRSISSGASAVSSLIKTFRVCAGIEDTVAKNQTFNFNFASTPPVRVGEKRAETVDVDSDSDGQTT